MTLEQLGYTCELDDFEDLVCKIQQGSATYIVEFHIEDKSFQTHGYAKGHGINHPIDMELYQAITLKLKELSFL